MAMSPQEVQTKLTEARAAYHQLATGTMARVFVDQNGERVEFAAANAGRLYQYILELERLGMPPCGAPSNGPAGFIF
jgi:hypothetical protein